MRAAGSAAQLDLRNPIVERGVLGDDLVVHATVDHFEDGVPWERMQRRAREQGVPLSANTLAAASGRAIDLRPDHPSYPPQNAQLQVVRLRRHRHPRARPEPRAGHPLGVRCLLLQGDHCYSYFMYAPSGHAHHLEAVLKGYKLASVMCDGANSNNCVERAAETRGGCNAHYPDSAVMPRILAKLGKRRISARGHS